MSSIRHSPLVRPTRHIDKLEISLSFVIGVFLHVLVLGVHTSGLSNVIRWSRELTPLSFYVRRPSVSVTKLKV